MGSQPGFFKSTEISSRYQSHSGCTVDHFSNTSEDAFGLQGAFANIADSIDRANDYIFIAGWMFEPWMHLPAYGEALRVGLTEQYQGNIAGAIEAYQAIIKQGCDQNGYAAFFLATALYQANKIEDAKDCLITSLKKTTQNTVLLNALARLYFEQGEFEKAKDQALLVFKAKSSDPDAMMILADCYKEQEEYESAKLVYENILRLDALNPISHRRLAQQGMGEIALAQSNLTDAEEYFRRCLWYYPQDPKALIGLSRTLKAKKESSKSEISIIDECFFNGLKYYEKNQNHQSSVFYKEALTEYTLWAVEYITINEKNFNAYYGLIDKALKVNPDDANLYIAKYNFLLKYGPSRESYPEHYQQMLKSFQAECQQQCNKHPLNRELHDRLYFIKSELGIDSQEEKETLQEKRDKFDELIMKGSVYKAEGIFSKAIYNFEQARLLNENNTDLLINLIESYLESKEPNYQKALEHVSSISKLSTLDKQAQQKLLALINQIPKSVKNHDDLLAIRARLDVRSLNVLQFNEGLTYYRETLPSLGETLIRKAIANPDMVIAINLWEQLKGPVDYTRYKYPIRELKKIAKDLGLTYPENILIRTNHCHGSFNSHHQKYVVMDDGNGDSTAYVGSCDLSTAKFDWAEHQLLNTVENNNAVDQSYGCHQWENHIWATNQDRTKDGKKTDYVIPRHGWREIITKIRGNFCNDVLRDFKARWEAKAGGTMRGYEGDDDDANLVFLVRDREGKVTETRGSVDFKLLVKLKIEEIINKANIKYRRSHYNLQVNSYQKLQKELKGNTFEEKVANARDKLDKLKVATKELYKESRARVLLREQELKRLETKYRDNPSKKYKIERAKRVLQLTRVRHESITSNYLKLFPENKKMQLKRSETREVVTSQVQLVTSTQSKYYKQNEGNFNREVDTSLREAYLHSIEKAENFIYLETQFFTCDHTDIESNVLIKALLAKIKEKHEKNEPFHFYLNVPYSPNGTPGQGLIVDPIRKTQHEVLTHMMKVIEEKTGEPWSKYLSVNFFAQWHGVDSSKAKRLYDGNQITRAESQAISRRAPIYNHSKMMIVDGDTVINGSANFSHRSMHGSIDTDLSFIEKAEEGNPASKRKIQDFMLKIVNQYFGTAIGNTVSRNLQDSGELGLGNTDVVTQMQQTTWGNLESFSQNNPGCHSKKETGLAVSFPYKREKGEAGKIDRDYEFIPDAPRDQQGNTPDCFRWVPQKDLPLSLELARKTGNLS